MMMEAKYMSFSRIFPLISLLLFAQVAGEFTCFCSPLKTNVSQQFSAYDNMQPPSFTGNGTIILKVYPDNSSEILCSIDLKGLNVSLGQVPEINMNFTSRPLEDGVRQDFIGFITVPEPENTRIAELLKEMLLNLEIKGNGSMDEISWQAILNFSLPEAVEIEAALSYYGNLTAGDCSLNATVTATLHYQALNITKEQIQNIVDFWPIFKTFIEYTVTTASEGLIRFEIDIKSSVIGDENAKLTVLIKASGKFIEGFEKIIENLWQMPTAGTSPEPLLEESLYILGNLSGMIKNLAETRYAWITKFGGKLSWMPKENRLLLEGYMIYAGDLGRQWKESMIIMLESLQKILPYLRGEGGVKGPMVMEQYIENLITMLSNSEFNIDWFSYSLRMRENNLKIEVSGIRVKPVQSILSFLRFASDIAPIENLKLIVQGSSNAEYMVEVEVPPELAAEIAEPHRMEGKQRLIWFFRSLGAIERLRFSRKPNIVGVIDFNYMEVEKAIGGVKQTVKIYTNSTVINASLLDNKLLIEASGLEGTTGALNITMSKHMIEGVIIVFVDGGRVKPKISYSEEEYSVYITYTHSLRRIEVTWIEPSLTIAADRTEANAGEEIEVSGTLTLLEMPMAGEAISIIVDGSKFAECATNSSGAYSTKLSLREGEYTVKAAYTFADKIFESRSLTIKIILPWYRNPYIIGGIITVIIIVGVFTLMLLRRKRSIS